MSRSAVVYAWLSALPLRMPVSRMRWSYPRREIRARRCSTKCRSRSSGPDRTHAVPLPLGEVGQRLDQEVLPLCCARTPTQIGWLGVPAAAHLVETAVHPALGVPARTLCRTCSATVCRTARPTSATAWPITPRRLPRYWTSTGDRRRSPGLVRVCPAGGRAVRKLVIGSGAIAVARTMGARCSRTGSWHRSGLRPG